MQLEVGVGIPVEVGVFQYPRSDRAGCNHHTPKAFNRSACPFSILGRIERDATRRVAQSPGLSR